MRRTTMAVATAASVLLTACGGSELVVETAIEQETAEGAIESVAIGGQEIQILPFDRDQVFDSLAQAYGEPEPAIPDTILQLQQQIAAAQDEWQTAESQWNTARDSLRRLGDRLQGLSRASADYRLAYQDFTDLEGQVGQLERRSRDAFQRFTALQTRFATSAEEIRLLRENWGDDAFAEVDDAFEAKLEEARRDMVVDTTNAAGMIRVQLPPGQWWIHSRYVMPFSELYWNVPVTVEGDSIHIQLTRENAQVRPKL
ncbi:MAG TPA: hypothetical protein VMK65_13480 [Longimicrobiales bacterium]|nr:hypothetical protein [Longimicrobiales bacterium]